MSNTDLFHVCLDESFRKRQKSRATVARQVIQWRIFFYISIFTAPVHYILNHLAVIAEIFSIKKLIVSLGLRY